MKLNTREITRIALFAALLVICANIAIPLPIGIPFTLQVFAVALMAFTLPLKETMLAISLYIFMGLAGLPVFSGWRGGLVQTIASPTFGFILGFIPMALAIFFVNRIGVTRHGEREKYNKIALFRATLASFAGLLLLYVFGLGIVYVNALLTAGEGVPFTKLLGAYCLPFLPLDAVKFVLAYVVSLRLKKILKLDKTTAASN